jgi:hypothetical protein
MSYALLGINKCVCSYTTIMKLGQLVTLPWPLSDQTKGKVEIFHIKSKAGNNQA